MAPGALLLVFPGIAWAQKRLWLCPRSLCLPCAASLSPRSSQQSPPGALSGAVLSSIWFFLHLPSCMSVCTPRAFQVAFGALEASEHVHCPLKFSFCLPLHPRALPGPSSTSGNSESLSEPKALQAPLPAPWVSPWAFLSPHLDFWDPPRDLPCAPVPSVWLAELWLAESPGDLALPLIPQGGRRQRRAAGWAPQALPNTSMAYMGGDPTATWMQGQVQKQRCGDLSFVHNPDESDLCKAEGRERGEKGEEKGERGERGEQAQAALRNTHLAGKAVGVIQGC